MEKKRRGFTLVEMMVVISIIGLLASVILASLSQTRGRANLAKRIESAKEVQQAIELYYVRNNNTYPSTGGALDSNCSAVGNQLTEWVPGLVTNGYISVLPTDPETDGVNHCCNMYKSNGTDYKLIFAYQCQNMTQAMYTQYPSLIDPERDGNTGNDTPPNCIADTVNVTAFAFFTPGGCNY